MHAAFCAVAVAYKALLYVYTLGSMSTIFVKLVQIREYSVDLLDETKKEGFVVRKLSILPKEV